MITWKDFKVEKPKRISPEAKGEWENCLLVTNTQYIFDILVHKSDRSYRFTIGVIWNELLGWCIPNLFNETNGNNITLVEAYGKTIELLFWADFPTPNLSMNYAELDRRIRIAREAASLSQAELGRRIRIAREAASLSQDDVAKHLVLSRSAISLIEGGKRKVDSLELKKFSSLVSKNILFFLGGEENYEK